MAASDTPSSGAARHLLPEGEKKRPRLPIIDIARGVAIVAMVIYHLCWDLSYYGFMPVDVGYDPGWVTFARSILFAFMFLVGVGLVLGHGHGMRWRGFWRRWLFLAGGAGLITLGTWLTFPESFVYFGVLHAIALFSILALPWLFTPLWLTGLVAVAVIGLHFLYRDPLFNAVPLSWIGLWETPPLTNDLVPVFPWLGVVLLGVIAARLVRGSAVEARLAAIQWRNRPALLLGWMGRWSLVIYLVHQPLLLAVIMPLSMATGMQNAGRELEFLNSCQASCEATGTSAALCAIYCQCGLEGVERDDLWEPIFSGRVSAAEQAQLDANNRQCSVLIYPELEDAPADGE
ncbi:heparan-alpha-glucosaminide N-acetyltransferase [Devosia sp. YIM 151766]|uniref:heparan-alpha-glucosaminide N-acetyltransferase n=1 Tax=Devosia sp. YIM 151766 TaxID=3017325 RepID=UPI00255C8505|nr:heparan-alpha-glucosaminide N-acetyltransferase [Devosia sp. YIM 151766]WIY53465.1 heparan-alpha-glucosaminide N-acetyltransferase [Devosia sp. YIM 151766]